MLVQDVSNKPRPMDNALEGQLNVAWCTLMQTTLEERDASYLEGPYLSAEVVALFGHSKMDAIRRLVLVQDVGNKLRPMDNALEGQLNVDWCTSI